MLNLGDIRGIDGTRCPAVDVITGGSPCQDLSISGSRAGLAGERSGLFIEQLRVVAEMRAATHGLFPRYMVWENVPGALSSNRGKDFLEVLNGCIRIVEPKAPDVFMPKNGKWPGSGILYDDLGRWSLAWRIHDAQFWGVPQRRRRIALIVDFGGLTAPEILFEPAGVPRYSQTGGESRQTSSDGADGRADRTVRICDAWGHGCGAVAATITGDHESRITDYTNLVYSLNADERESGLSVIVDKTHTLKTTTRESVAYCIGNGQANQGCIKELSHTLNCMHDQRAIICDRAAYNQGENAKYEPYIDYTETVPTIIARGPHAVSAPPEYAVRRLTPLECERLQGYPDGWTDIGDWVDSAGKRHRAADTPRYRALGNSLALPFWRWLLNRIYDKLASNSHIPTLGSLFDGIGGFPRVWPGVTSWTSEIDEFCIAVVDYHARRNEL